jgi:methanethiol S-methyltransferase
MNAVLIGWLNFGSMIVATIIMSVMYVMSVHPARLEQKIGEKAYRRSAILRNVCFLFMGVAMVNYVLYLFYPLPVDPFPARFGWPYWVNLVLAVALAIPTLIVFIRGNLDAGTETLFPDKKHTMYAGIYKKIRHPQALGEAPMFIWISLLMNSPFLTVFSLIYLPIFYWWCLEEEKDLLLRYGEAYADYMEQTGRFFPKRKTSI